MTRKFTFRTKDGHKLTCVIEGIPWTDWLLQVLGVRRAHMQSLRRLRCFIAGLTLAEFEARYPHWLSASANAPRGESGVR